ncbi:MAG: D-sedoheptulose 7-phosphate isomerase [bacterium]|nr:D-sedoheptulose 7-phosphate isomerase [bacterium]
MEVQDQLVKIFYRSIEAKEAFLKSNLELVETVVLRLVLSLQSGGKVLLFGNGGSAADAQHLAAEFVNRFLYDRPALPAIALTTDSSVLTSISNDADYSQIFSRQIEALGKAGDVAIGISTSGNSPNVLLGLQKGKQMGLYTVAFSGGDGGKIKTAADVCLTVPCREVPRIQEVHITLGHAICELVEAAIFPKGIK